MVGKAGCPIILSGKENKIITVPVVIENFGTKGGEVTERQETYIQRLTHNYYD